jgi:hypothetical protein
MILLVTFASGGIFLATGLQALLAKNKVIRFAPFYYYFLLRFKAAQALVESKHNRNKTLLPYS